MVLAKDEAAFDKLYDEFVAKDRGFTGSMSLMRR